MGSNLDTQFRPTKEEEGPRVDVRTTTKTDNQEQEVPTVPSRSSANDDKTVKQASKTVKQASNDVKKAGQVTQSGDDVMQAATLLTPLTRTV